MDGIIRPDWTIKRAKAKVLDNHGYAVQHGVDGAGDEITFAGPRAYNINPLDPDQRQLEVVGHHNGDPLIQHKGRKYISLFERGVNGAHNIDCIPNPDYVEPEPVKANVRRFSDILNGAKSIVHEALKHPLRMAAGIAAIVTIGTAVEAFKPSYSMTSVARADPLKLEMRVGFDDGGAPIAGSRFIAGYDSNDAVITDNYDPARDFELQLPYDPRKIGAYTTVDDFIHGGKIDLMVDKMRYDPNAIDVEWNINLIAIDPNGGFNGTASVDIVDPNKINIIPDYAVAYFTRKDSNGVPIQNYSIRDPNNHSISWADPNTGSSRDKPFASMDLIIRDEYLAVLNSVLGSTHINFDHHAILALNWMETGPYKGDFNGDNIVNWKDLAILTKYWLY